MILTPLQKLPKNVEDFGKLIVAKGLKKLPKVKKKSPNLVTLLMSILSIAIVHDCQTLIQPMIVLA